MKLKRRIMSALAVVLSLVLVFAFVACGGKDPEVTAIELDVTTAEIATQDTLKLNVTATYSDGTTSSPKSSEITWTSSDDAVASVSRTGSVTGKARGTATITAKVGEFEATCSVTVYSLVIELTGEGVVDGAIELERDQTLALTATVLKDGVAQEGAEIEWSVEDEGKAVVTVSNGVVTALNPGVATVIATRAGGTQSAQIEVTVKAPEGFELSQNYEQNKAPAGTWGHWSDKNYNWANAVVNSAYYEEYEKNHEADEGYQYIGANKMTVNFKILSYGGTLAPGPKDATIQLFYRSSQGNDGQLLPNHNYEVKLKLTTNKAGIVNLNGFDDYAPAREQNDGESDEDYKLYLEEYNAAKKEHYKKFDFEVKAGVVNELKVTFRHGDSGNIYKDGVYDNVESAIHLLLGLLDTPDDEESVQVSVFDIQYKDMGESTNKWEDDKTKLEGYEPPPGVLPDLSGVDSVALEMATTEDGYEITSEADNKSHNVVYTDIVGGNYKNIAISIPTEADVANCNTFAVTIKNNGDTKIELRFDIACDTGIENGANGNSKDCATGSVASVGTANTDTVWDGTTIQIAPGAETTLCITFDTTTGRGVPSQILIYFETHYWANSQDNPDRVDANYSGNVTFSDFKFANVTEDAEAE